MLKSFVNKLIGIDNAETSERSMTESIMTAEACEACGPNESYNMNTYCVSYVEGGVQKHRLVRATDETSARREFDIKEGTDKLARYSDIKVSLDESCEASTVDAVNPDFERALASLEIPKDATEETRQDYIRDNLDRALGLDKDLPPQEEKVSLREASNVTVGKTLSMSQADYLNAKNMISSYNADNEKDRAKTRKNVKKVIIGITKALPKASETNPVDGRILEVINLACKTFVTQQMEIDRSTSAKDVIKTKLMYIRNAI